VHHRRNILETTLIYLAIENLAQLLAVHPGTGRAFCGVLAD
jgi:hypothetical protein